MKRKAKSRLSFRPGSLVDFEISKISVDEQIASKWLGIHRLVASRMQWATRFCPYCRTPFLLQLAQLCTAISTNRSYIASILDFVALY